MLALVPRIPIVATGVSTVMVSAPSLAIEPETNAKAPWTKLKDAFDAPGL